MRALILLLCVAGIAGCSLSKDESTLARLHDEVANKKKALPKGFLKEDEIGVRYYPGSDFARSRQYDEDGAHILEVILGTDDSTDKVGEFYEKEIGAKATEIFPHMYTVQADRSGKHYQVDYGRFENTTITIKVSTPQG